MHTSTPNQRDRIHMHAKHARTHACIRSLGLHGARCAAYYRGAMGILLVYDVTDEASFNNIRNWMRNIEQHASDNVNKVRGAARRSARRGAAAPGCTT